MNAPRKSSAFTFAELIFVLTLLAIPASLLFPAITRARQKVQRANCQSNLRQIGAAWLQYARDYDGTMMRFSTDAPCDLCVAPTGSATAATATPPSETRYWWGTQQGDKHDASQSLLRPYLARDKTYSCPAFARLNGAELGLTSYGYNAGTLSPTRYGPAPAFAPTPLPKKLTALAAPARTVAFADAAQLNSKGALRPSTYLSKPASEFPNFHARHLATGNVLFCDGHIEIVRPTYRPADFTAYAGTNAVTLQQNSLGDIDEDGNLKTNELFSGTGKP